MDSSQSARELRIIEEQRTKLLESVADAEGKGNVDKLPYFNYIVRQVLEPLAECIRTDSARAPTSRQAAGAFKKFARYLGSLDAEVAALTACKAILRTLMQEGGMDEPQPLLSRAARAAGKAIYHEYLMTHFKGLSPELFNTLLREFSKTMTRDERTMIKRFRGTFDAAGYSFPVWEFGDIEHVGMYLVRKLVALGLMDMSYRMTKKGGKMTMVGYLNMAPELRSSSEELMGMIADHIAFSAPMIEPPLPWNADTNSGDGFHSEDARRAMTFHVKGYGQNNISPMLINSLNYLQAVPWEVNTRVLDAVREASQHYDFGSVTSPMTDIPAPYPEGGTDAQIVEWKTIMRGYYTERKLRGVHHMKAQKAFREAQELAQYPSIWFAYYADSRGRKYARAGGISPQGNDLEKGLIRFHKGEPIDSDEAAYWFKIAGANRYGVDKVNFPDRLAWVEANHLAIMMTAEDPLNSPFWREADSPVQFLAWAMEYSDWVKNPDTFLNHLPLGQDGTCNGLQNYSALFRDEVGGYATNLVPGDKPRDIYAIVAEFTLTLLQKATPDRFRDMWLKHGLTRKVTKRTTMTLLYGATRFAASEFINKDYIEVVKPPEIPLADYGDAANYLSHHVWEAIGNVVIKAREGMDWLKAWAKHCVHTDQPVAWVAPNGLRVVSEYEKTEKKEVTSIAFGTRITLNKVNDAELNLRKIQFAVAPNFVHSLDAAHLDWVIARLIAEGCPALAAIHDDFGTYARYTALLHRAIREEFVRMYMEYDVIGIMVASTGCTIPPPEHGKLDLELVKQSPYFFG